MPWPAAVMSGLDAASLRDETLRGLRAIVPIDAAFFAVVDPATMLFTAILAEEPLGEAGGLRVPRCSLRMSSVRPTSTSSRP